MIKGVVKGKFALSIPNSKVKSFGRLHGKVQIISREEKVMKICRSRLNSLLRYGKKHSGPWDDEDVCVDGPAGCFVPDDTETDTLIRGYDLIRKVDNGTVRIIKVGADRPEITTTEKR